MLDSGKKFALCATKKINISTLVIFRKKTHSPPWKLNGRPLNTEAYLKRYSDNTAYVWIVHIKRGEL
jgi:hypothetical protein